MDNNNYSQPQYNQQPYGQQYAQAYGQPPVIDPTYEQKSKEFLTKTIVAGCISALPVGSIIAIFMASNNRKALRSTSVREAFTHRRSSCALH